MEEGPGTREDSIKIDLTVRESEVADRINLGQDKEQWLPLASMTTKRLAP
jgi:hypothetical protein